MENFNNIQKTGTIGAMVDGINSNFTLTKEMLERLSVSKDMSCGLFGTSTELTTAYPSPTVGMWALVGSTSPFAVYRCSTAGIWADTGETYTSEIDMTDYVKKTDLETQEELPLSQYTSFAGYYQVTGSGSSTTASRSSTVSLNTFMTYDIPVTVGQRYRAKSHNGGNAMAQIIFWDSNGDYVSLINRGDNDDHDETFEVPVGVTLMSYCLTNSSSYSRELWKYIGLPDVMDGMQAEIEELQNDLSATDEKAEEAKDAVDAITETVTSPNLFDKSQVVNQVVNTSGGLTTVGSWAYNKCTGLIPVTGGKVYCISGVPVSAGNNIRCLAADGSTRMKVLGAQSGTAYSTNYQMPKVDASGAASSMNGQFKAPDNAAYVQFNVGTNADYTDTAMLELVGDAYDSEFTPSPYQPYGSEVKIKEEALPDDIGGADMALRRRFNIKVLLIGSSHGMNTIAQFPWIAYKSGFTNIMVGNIFKGSLTLQQIATAITNNTTIGGWFKVFENGVWAEQDDCHFDYVVGFTDWDYIILQRSAGEDETWTSQQSSDYNTIVERIKTVAASHAPVAMPTILFNTGFADPSPEAISLLTHTRSIVTSAKKMRDEYHVDILPSAVAIQNARQTSLANLGNYAYHLLCYDGQHLDYGIGCYVTSATLFHKIFSQFGFSVLTACGYGTYDEVKTFVGSTFIDAGGVGNAYTEPTSATMTIARQCAIAACENLDTYTPQASPKYGVVFDVYNSDNNAPTDAGVTGEKGVMYYFRANNSFMLKVGNSYYGTFPCYPNASDYAVTLGVTYWCGNKAYTVQGDGQLAEGLNWVGTQAQYDALSAAQQASIIADIIEE